MQHCSEPDALNELDYRMRRTLSGCVPAALQSTVEFLSGSHCPVPFRFKFPSDCQQNRNLTGRHKSLCRHFDRSERTPPGASPYIKFDRREGDNLSRPRPPVWCPYILPTTRRVLATTPTCALAVTALGGLSSASCSSCWGVFGFSATCALAPRLRIPSWGRRIYPDNRK